MIYTTIFSKRRRIYLLLLLLVNLRVYGQLFKEIRISFPDGFESKNISYFYFDGKSFIPVDSLSRNQFFDDVFISKVAGQSILDIRMYFEDLKDSSMFTSRQFYTDKIKSSINFQNTYSNDGISFLGKCKTDSIVDFSVYQSEAYLNVKEDLELLNAIYTKVAKGIHLDSVDIVMNVVKMNRLKVFNSLLNFIKNNAQNYGNILLYQGFIQQDLCLNDSLLLHVLRKDLVSFNSTTEYKYIENKIIESECLQKGDSTSYKNIQKLQVNFIRPSFEGYLLDSNLFTIDSTLGHKVLLNFWATWCGPCIQEIPHIKKFQKSHPEYKIISVAWDEDTDKVNEMIHRLGINWEVVLMNTSILKKYQITSIPKNIFINENGLIFSIRSQTVSFDDMNKIVEGF